MRIPLVAALLATAASSAIAAVQDHGDPAAETTAERSERAPPRMRDQHRPERAERVEREPHMPGRSRDGAATDAAHGAPMPAWEAPRERPQPRVAREEPRSHPARDTMIERAERSSEQAQRGRAGDTVRDWRMRDRQRADSPAAVEDRNLGRTSVGERSRGGLVQSDRPLPRVFDPAQRRVSSTPVFGTEPPPPPTAVAAESVTAQHRWRTDWRDDRRYNWWDWRSRNRARFHLGFYYDPFGWDYFRYHAGWRLWPSHYSSRYWLHDPWHYRLPPVYGPYRWVRYWDDALLVDIYTGQVVDVIHDFFW